MKAIVTLWAALLPAVFAVVARAGDGYAVPDVDRKINWIAIAITVVALLAVCALGFKNSKRSHLD